MTDAITEASKMLWGKGIKVLQGVRLADTEALHIRRLLSLMNPGRGEHWIDIGAGFGEPARLMRAERPDLRFTLVGTNQFQLDLAPAELPRHHVDMHRLPFSDGGFDGAMFLWSLCHAENLVGVLREAARVVRPGGGLFVYDLVRLDGNNDLARRWLRAEFHSSEHLDRSGQAAGWRTFCFTLPCAYDDTLFRECSADLVLYDELMRGLTPVIWQATRDA